MSLSFEAPLLDGADGGPLYLRLTAAIRRAIEDGDLRPDDALPSEREIASRAGVSRVTVRKAIGALVEDGTLRHRHGSGTFVARPVTRVEMGLSHLKSFTEDMESRGHATTSRWLERVAGSVTPDEAMHLRLSPGARVWRLGRLRLAGGTPMAIERATVPTALLADAEAVDASLYDALERAGCRPVRALQRITAAVLSPGDAALLELAPGAPALAMLRISFDTQDRTVEMTRSLYRGDAYDFVAEMTIG